MDAVSRRACACLWLLAALASGPAWGAASRTYLFSNWNPMPVGYWNRLTANVAGDAGVPSGNVSFLADGAPIPGCEAIPVVGGIAQCILREMVAGTHATIAAYGGDALHAASSSAVLAEVVEAETRAGTNATLVSSSRNSQPGQEVVFTLTLSGSATPTGTIAFRAARLPSELSYSYARGGAIPGCATVPLVPVSAGVSRATCPTSALSMGLHSISASYSGDGMFAPRDSLDETVGGWTRYFNQWVWGSTNFALATAGGSASVSSDAGSPFSSVAAIVDGELMGVDWGNGGGWQDGTPDVFPDAVEIKLAGRRVIDRVVVHGLRDDYASPRTYFANELATLYRIDSFEVHGWNGASWIPLATVAGNTQVHRSVTFEPFLTDRVRVVVTGAARSSTRIVEIEVFGGDPGANTTNVALARAGATVEVSSDYGAPFSLPGAVIDDDRRSGDWGRGDGWQDATFDQYPDVVQVNFAGLKAINQVVVHSLPDWYADNATTGEAFSSRTSLYGIVDYSVEAWTGLRWVVLAAVTGEQYDRRTIMFAPIVTDRIRVVVTRARLFNTRIVEIEAWGTPAEEGPTNVASARAGATATASSDYGAPYSSVEALIDGDTTGRDWGRGGGWEDGTSDAYPDWVQVNFHGAQTIDRVIVYSLGDDYGHGLQPMDSTTFALYGVVAFSVEAWDGATWVTLASVTGNNLVKRTVTFAPVTTDRIRVRVTQGLYYKSRIVEVEAWGVPASSARANVALASLGAVASASSDRGAPISAVSAVNDGDFTGAWWGDLGGWEDATFDAFPDWVQIAFAGARTIDQVVVHSLRDDYGHVAAPTESTTFTLYGVIDFTVEGWNGTGWTTLGTVTGNDRVSRAVSFAPFTTDRIRVTVNRGAYYRSRIVEIEVMGTPAGQASTPSNVAALQSGATVTASSDYGAPHSLVEALIDGDLTGRDWGRGGGWEDGTFDAYPDWVQVNFSGAKTIDRVVVYSLQDDYGRGMTPTEWSTFALYGVVDFTVEGWDGAAWTPLASVTGNNLVKRTVTFAPVTTDRIRVGVTQGLYHKSRMVEVQAWGTPAPWARANVALASLGAVASASSDRGPPISAVSAVNDGDFTGAWWGDVGGWEDATFDAFPDWVQIAFAGARTIDQVVVHSLRDDYGRVVAPTESTTFTLYGVIDFTVEGWNGVAWSPLATVTGNDRVSRAVSFAPITTDRIRVTVDRGAYYKSRIVEIEAFGH